MSDEAGASVAKQEKRADMYMSGLRRHIEPLAHRLK